MVSQLSGDGHHGNGNGPLIGRPLPTITGNHYRSLQTITVNHYQPLPDADQAEAKKIANVARFLHREFGLLLYDIAELLGVCPQQVAVWLND